MSSPDASSDGSSEGGPSRGDPSGGGPSGDQEQPRSSRPEVEETRSEQAQSEQVQSEQARLRALRRYEVVGTEPEPNFDRITRVAASLFDAPIALINFVAAGREWRKSAVGVESGEQDLRSSFCLEAIRSGETTVIEDVARAERFSGHPLVEDPPGVRFYAGAPLETPDGYRIGTLCVLDTAPRSLSEEEARRLEDLAEMAVSELEQRRRARQRLQEKDQHLQEKDRRLQSIAESVSEGIYRSTPEGELTYANQAFAEMFGYDSVEEVLEVGPEELYADPAEREEVLERADERGGLSGEDIEFRRADGSTFVGRVTDTVVRGEDGEVSHYGGVVTDVTERRRREEELRRQKALLEQTQRLTGAWEADLKSGEIDWSEKVYEIHEMDPEAPVDLKKGLEFYLPEAREAIREATRALTEEGEPYDLELRIETAEGNRRWVRTVGAPAETEQGEVIKVAGAVQDITERKEAERNRRRMAKAIEAAPDGVALLDEDGMYTYANQSHAEIYGYDSPEALLGRSWKTCYRDAEIERFEDTIMPKLREEGAWRGDATGRREDGTLFPQSITLALLDDGGIVCVVRDITDRKRREQKLKESRRELREEKRRIQAITENVSDGIYRSTEEEGIAYANSAFVEMFGYRDLEELRAAEGKALYADPARREELIEKEAEEGGLDQEEVRFRRKDGSTFIGLLSTQQVEAEAGKTYFDGAITDITERKRYEQELERQNDLFRKAQSLANVGGWEFDVNNSGEGMLTEQAYRIHGLSPDDEMTPERSLSFYHPEDRPRVQNAISRAVEDGETYDLQVRLITDAGEEKWIRTRGEPQRKTDNGEAGSGEAGSGEAESGEGEVTRVRGTIQDITERKRQEQVLRERQDKIEALYEATGTLLRAEAKPEVPGRLAGIVEGALGYPATTIRLAEDGELKPSRVPEVVQDHMPERPAYDIDGDTPAAQAYRAGESRVYDDLSAEAEDLDRGDIRATAYVPMGAYGLISVGSLEVGGIGSFDRRLIEVLGAYAALVLDRIGREEELIEAKEEAEKTRRDAQEARREAEEARREAEEASRLKSSFLANMSHEIRTPLTSIIGFAEALGTEASELDLPEGSPLPKYAGLIEKGGKRLLKTLEGVLNLSKLEAGQMELEAGPVDLSAEARRAAEELRPRAEEKGLGFQVRSQGDAPIWAEADEGGVQIVMQNLLSNAIKYTEEGSVEVRIYREESKVAVEVEDTGIGMEPEVAEDLFEPFRQASEGFGRKYEGTGVGLAVTKRAVEEMDGQVEVKTQKGEGSRFTVRLPGAEGPPERER